jgi:hypothetical protein
MSSFTINFPPGAPEAHSQIQHANGKIMNFAGSNPAHDD